MDSEKAYANFIEGKEILEKHNTPASNLYPEENYYVLADGTNVGIGIEFGISTKNSTYYAQIGVTNAENMEKFTSATESVVNEQDAVQKVKETLENAGYTVENLVFQTSSLSADILREIEDQYVAEGLLEESKRKPDWTSGDDVCIVYARPVSYTHLDVYKRQTLDMGRRDEGSEDPAETREILVDTGGTLP